MQSKNKSMNLEQLLTETKTWTLLEFYDKIDLGLYMDKIAGRGYDLKEAFNFIEGQVVYTYILTKGTVYPILEYISLYEDFIKEGKKYRD